MSEDDIMDTIKDIFKVGFSYHYTNGGAWYSDWKLWAGAVMYVTVWSKWLAFGMEWRAFGMDFSFAAQAIHCFGADLLILHYLQFFGTAGGLEALVGFIIVQALATAIVSHRPSDLVKAGTFVSTSSYSNFAGSFLQASWHFLGQLIFMLFYFYSLYKNYAKIDGQAEYLFWFAGYFAVQMTLYYSRGADSQLGGLMDVPAYIYIFKNIQELEFSTELHGEMSGPFQLQKLQFYMRCFYAFAINLLARDLIGFSVPILLMSFHDPINCVIYSIAVNFIVTMDDSSEVVYQVAKQEGRGDRDLEAYSSWTESQREALRASPA